MEDIEGKDTVSKETAKHEKEQMRYIAIDLKSFYASVECIERGLDPLQANLVVADPSRTDKTICLAVSPALKSLGIPGRPRLFEVIQQVKEINVWRQRAAPGQKFAGSSIYVPELAENPALSLDYIVAPPQMAHYLRKSAEIYGIYLRYIAPEDIHPYSIDEVFIDAGAYLETYGLTARQLAGKMMREVIKETGITATAGIGTNLYLAKVAMDIEAKHQEADADSLRIAELDEMEYRRRLWSHTPITDFWRVGRGYAERLAEYGLYTMGDIALCSAGKLDSFRNEELLYRLFGVNAELLIDHAWGWEPCTMQDIKAYKPKSNSVCSGQVLQCPYTFEKAGIVLKEMADDLALSLAGKGLMANQLVLTVGYDIENIRRKRSRKEYAASGGSERDRYGREVPRHAHGTANLGKYTASSVCFMEETMNLYERIVDQNLLIRRLTLSAEHVCMEAEVNQEPEMEQLDLFTDYAAKEREREQEKAAEDKERRLQKALLDIKEKYGKNAILRGTSFLEGATGRERNEQIGGHKA